MKRKRLRELIKMEIMVPYTIILQDVVTGSVSSKVIQAPQDTRRAYRYVSTALAEEAHVVALVKGEHPVIIGSPGPT
jgi:hypothetical protein